MATPRRLRSTGLLETRDGTPANKDSRLVNCILEPNGKELDFIKRGGYSSLVSPASGTGQGATLINTASGNAQILSIVNNQLYTTYFASYASLAWTARSSAANNQWVSVAWSPGLSLFAAVSADGTTTQIMTSPDGVTWTLRSHSGGLRGFTWITWCDNLGLFVAVCNSGGGIGANKQVITSPNGTTWTDRTASENNDWQSICWSPQLKIFCAVAINGTHQVMTSPDSVTWTVQSSSNTNQWRAVCWSPQLAIFCAVAQTGSSNRVMTSPDGITWTTRTSAADNIWSNIVWADNLGLFVSVSTDGASRVMTSPDGITWTSRTAATANPWAGLTWAAGPAVLVAVSTSGATNNCMVSTDGITWTLVTTPNSNSYAGVAYAPSLGLFAAVSTNGAGNRVMSGVATTGTSNTTVTTGTNANFSEGGFYDFSQVLDRTKIAIKNTVGMWVYTPSGQTLVAVTSPNYPPLTARGLVYLDGTFYVMDTYGTIYGSNVNDPATWTALNKLNAQSEPDGGTCIIKYNQYVVAFGNYTTEFFYDAGNALGSPLSSVQNSQLLVGCTNGDCVVQAQAAVFFPARAKATGQAVNTKIFIAKLEGMSYKQVSNPDVERILNADGLSGAWGWFGVWMSHPCYNLVLPTTGYMLVYDIQQGYWNIFNKQTASAPVSVTSITCAAAYVGSTAGVATVTATSHGFSDGDPIVIAGASPAGYNGTFNITYIDANTFTYPTSTVLATASGTITATGNSAGIFPALCAFDYNNSQVFQNKLNGGIYTLSDTLYTDDSNYIDTKVRSMRFDQGLSEDGNSQNKFNPWIDLISDKTSASTNVLIRWSDDDYQTYSNYRPVDISLSRSRLGRCGAFIRRAFEIRHTASSAYRMQGIDLGLEQGGE